MINHSISETNCCAFCQFDPGYIDLVVCNFHAHIAHRWNPSPNPPENRWHLYLTRKNSNSWSFYGKGNQFNGSFTGLKNTKTQFRSLKVQALIA